MTNEQIIIQEERKAYLQCLECKKRCTHEKQDKHKCKCECKLNNLHGDCLGFIDKAQEYRA